VCRQYGVDIPGHILGERVGAFMHMYTLYGGTRPFGSNSLIATYDRKAKHALYLAETSGVVHRFYATAIGKHRQAAKTELEKLKLNDITCAEALPAVAKMFLSQRDDQKEHELEMAWLTEGNGWVFEQACRRLAARAFTLMKQVPRSVTRRAREIRRALLPLNVLQI
jgi:20S proteasome subunit alpha 7